MEHVSSNVSSLPKDDPRRRWLSHPAQEFDGISFSFLIEKLLRQEGSRYWLEHIIARLIKSNSPSLKWESKMEVKIGNKGRITLPHKLRLLLGIREGDSLTIEVSGSAILLKPKGASVRDTWGSTQIGKVEIKEIEEAAGREA